MCRFATIASVIAIVLLVSCAEDIPEPLTEEDLLRIIGDKPTEQEQITLPDKITGRNSAPMMLIPAGEFQMGTPDGESDEKPVHTVYLDAFYLDVYEVTNAQYKRFIDATGHRALAYWSDLNLNAPEQPVVGVSWHDAVAYCEWAGERLPTEAEWEKAARGGLVGKKYTWGDDWPPPSKAGNFADKAFKRAFPDAALFITGYDDGYAYPASVGKFAPNGYGLYDMTGNVWEWCSDWYDSGYYANSPRRNPMGPNSGTRRVVRGGSWRDANALHVRVALHNNDEPMGTPNNFGFRCVMDVTP